MENINKLIHDIANIKKTQYNIADIDTNILDKAAKMSYAISQALRDEIHERELAKYCDNITGKYVILTTSIHGPVYMLVRSAFITNYYSSGEKCICFQGTAFNYTLNSEYADVNFQHFSTWDDVYVKLDDLKKNDSIQYITKEIFETTFNTMIDELKETFGNWNT